MVVILPQGLPGIFCFSTHFFVAPCLVELLSAWLVAANCERQWCYLLVVVLVEKRRLLSAQCYLLVLLVVLVVVVEKRGLLR